MRPIAICETLIKPILAAYAHIMQPLVRKHLSQPVNFAPNGVQFQLERDATAQVGSTIRLLVELALAKIIPELVIFRSDATNAFGSISRDAIFAAMKAASIPDPFIEFYKHLYQNGKLITGAGEDVNNNRGVRQGDASSSLLFTLATKPVLDAIMETLLETDLIKIPPAPALNALAVSEQNEYESQETIVQPQFAIADDDFLAVNNLDAVKRAVLRQQELGPAIGYTFNLHKCSIIHIRDGQILDSSLSLSNGDGAVVTIPSVSIDLSSPLCGFPVLGIPVGSHSATVSIIQQTIDETKECADAIVQAANQHHWLSIQDAILLLRSCCSTKSMYLQRTLPISEEQQHDLDSHLIKATTQLLSLDVEPGLLAPLIGLPLRHAGVGVHLSQFENHAAMCGFFIRTIHHGIPAVSAVFRAALRHCHPIAGNDGSNNHGSDSPPTMQSFLHSCSLLHPPLQVNIVTGVITKADSQAQVHQSAAPPPAHIQSLEQLQASQSDDSVSRSPIIVVDEAHAGPKSIQAAIQAHEHEFRSKQLFDSLEQRIHDPQVSGQDKRHARELIYSLRSVSHPTATAFLSTVPLPHLRVSDDAFRFFYQSLYGARTLPILLEGGECPCCHMGPIFSGHERICRSVFGLIDLRHDTIMEHLFRFMMRCGLFPVKEHWLRPPVNASAQMMEAIQHGQKQLNGRRIHSNAGGGCRMDIVVELEHRQHLIDLTIGDLASSGAAGSAALSGSYPQHLESGKQSAFSRTMTGEPIIQHSTFIPFALTNCMQLGPLGVDLVHKLIIEFEKTHELQHHQQHPQHHLFDNDQDWLDNLVAGQLQPRFLYAEIGAIIVRFALKLQQRFLSRASAALSANRSHSQALQQRQDRSAIRDSFAVDSDSLGFSAGEAEDE